jgi:hypothetical protein
MQRTSWQLPWLPESADMTTTMPLAPRRSFPMTQHPTWNMSQVVRITFTPRQHPTCTGPLETETMDSSLSIPERQPNSESIAMTRENLHQHRKMITLSLKDGIQLLALSSSGSHNIGVMGQSVSVNATSFRFSLGSFTMETSGMPGMRNSKTPQCQPSFTNSSTLVRSGSLCTRVATKESLRSIPLIQRLGVCE